MRNLNLNWSHEYEELASDGKQSKIERNWSLLPWDSLALVVQVLEEGDKKYGRFSWKTIPMQDHINHVVEHSIATYQVESKLLLMEHLTHSICRAMFALQLLYEEMKNDN
jgi:hypothetical protein